MDRPFAIRRTIFRRQNPRRTRPIRKKRYMRLWPHSSSFGFFRWVDSNPGPKGEPRISLLRFKDAAGEIVDRAPWGSLAEAFLKAARMNLHTGRPSVSPGFLRRVGGISLIDTAFLTFDPSNSSSTIEVRPSRCLGGDGMIRGSRAIHRLSRLLPPMKRSPAGADSRCHCLRHRVLTRCDR